MQMLGDPSQHGERHSEIIVQPGRTFVDRAALALLGLQCRKLLISALAVLATSKQDPTVSQLGEQELKQEGPANVIDWDKFMSDRPRRARRAIARATDWTPMTRRPKVSNRVSP
jgi:hypothetical protein